MNQRDKAVEWIISLHFQYNFSTDTLETSIKIFEFFLRKVSISSENLQLVAVTSFWIATKLNNSVSISTEALSNHCSFHFQSSDFTQIEKEILIALDWKVNFSSIRMIIHLCLNKIEGEKPLPEFAEFFYFVSLLNHNLLDFHPEQIAIDCVCFTCLNIRQQCPLDKLQHFAHVNEASELGELVTRLFRLQKQFFKIEIIVFFKL